MSTDAGSAAAPEDSATRDVASERPGLESGDPGSADSATSTPETADRGVDGSADPGADSDTGSDSDTGTGADSDDGETGSAGGRGAVTDDSSADDSSTGDSSGSGGVDENPAAEGFITTMLRDATITGLPGETGAPPVEPHAPQAQQEGDEPVGAEAAAEADAD